MAPSDKVLVLSNCASIREARRIARALVERRLAACVNVVSGPMESTYRWKGKVETAREFLLLVKTSRAQFRTVERTIRKLHSYDLPEIIAVPLVGGSRAYLAWLGENIRQ
jgi:periplasmic divalent cation tolerance protein